MSILKFEILYNTQTQEFCVTNTETGEMKTTGAKKSTKKTKPAVSGIEPKLILEDNKYCLTEAAVELLGVEPGCKLDIQYDKNGPIIADDEIWSTGKGNKLTKSLTVACRGVKREELEKYGTEFNLVPIPEKEGMFYLKSNSIFDVEEVKNVEELEEELGTPIDEDLQDLIDDPDATTFEIDSTFFKL